MLDNEKITRWQPTCQKIVQKRKVELKERCYNKTSKA